MYIGNTANIVIWWCKNTTVADLTWWTSPGPLREYFVLKATNAQGLGMRPLSDTFNLKVFLTEFLECTHCDCDVLLIWCVMHSECLQRGLCMCMLAEWSRPQTQCSGWLGYHPGLPLLREIRSIDCSCSYVALNFEMYLELWPPTWTLISSLNFDLFPCHLQCDIFLSSLWWCFWCWCPPCYCQVHAST